MQHFNSLIYATVIQLIILQRTIGVIGRVQRRVFGRLMHIYLSLLDYVSCFYYYYYSFYFVNCFPCERGRGLFPTGGSSSHAARLHFIKTSWAMKKATQCGGLRGNVAGSQKSKSFCLFLPPERFVIAFFVLSLSISSAIFSSFLLIFCFSVYSLVSRVGPSSSSC